jgi:SAM-dependent methyltransferase
MNLSGERACPVCGSTSHVAVGPILHPRPTLVAGVPLDLGEQAFTLRRCPTCEFQFKDPPIDPGKLLACYCAASSTNWQESPDPRQRRFDDIREILKRYSRGRRILDVGCFNGAMLQYLGNDWERFGIEPCSAAAQLAQTRGVTILADTLEGISAAQNRFDAILAIDVVEHLVEPIPFFRDVSVRLLPGGVFILLTGNTSALAWRLQGSMYWYCSLPEHVSFYNRRSLERVGSIAGLDYVDSVELTHKRYNPLYWAVGMAKNATYVGGRAVSGLGIPPLRRLFLERRGPSTSTAKDHLVCVFRKR